MNTDRPFRPYMVVTYRNGEPKNVWAVPTESSHEWWEIIETRQARHRSELGRIWLPKTEEN